MKTATLVLVAVYATSAALSIVLLVALARLLLGG